MPRGPSCRTHGRSQRSKKQVTGKPDDIERVTSGLAGGRRRRGRKTTSPAAYPTTSNSGGPLGRMFHLYNFTRDEYLSHYYKRSNVESTVSMIKPKLGTRSGARPRSRCGTRL